MKSVVAYIRGLLGWVDETPQLRTSFKRDRPDDDFSSDDELPALKRLKKFKKSQFPDIMSSDDLWDKCEKSSNVRYVPIQVEARQPSTSTPLETSSKLGSRIRSVPVKVLRVSENGSGTPSRKPRIHTPVRPIVHNIENDDDDDEEEEVTLIDTNKKAPSMYIALDDYNNDQEDDVIFVKKVTAPVKQVEYVSRNSRDVVDAEQPLYYKLRKANERNSMSPKTYSKFKAPVGITKSYKKATSIPKWIHTGKNMNLSNSRQKLGINNNVRSTLLDVFNLDDKKNYQELIRRVSESMTPVNKPLDIYALAEDSNSFRKTQRAQKKALDEIKLVERGLSITKEKDAGREYDPITVASINSSDSEVEIVTSEASTSSSVKIDPINTLRDSFKDKAVIADDYLSKIDSKYRKKRQETQAKLKEARQESDIISKVNYEQKIAHLENKLKYELSIPESLFEEAEAVFEFPPLTKEQEVMIQRAIGPGPPSQIVADKFGLKITRRDLQTLAGLNWLNDEVINFYMNLIMQRSEEKKNLPKVYATNTFFFPRLMQSGHAGLRRWTRKVDLFAHDLMVIPVHLGVHWCLSYIDFPGKTISYLDSMGGRNPQCLDALMKYVVEEHQDKKGQPLDTKDWKTECISKSIPQQMNGSDCGMFLCTFAEFRARGAGFSFGQAHMPYLRRKAALEIISGRLLL